MDNDTRTLLNLTDPHLNFPHHWLKYKVIKNVRVAQIFCTLSYTPRACPNCGVINRGQILKYGFYQAKHKYGQFRAQPLVLLVNTQRFQCPDCHTTFNATSYLFEKQRTISRDLRREVILRLTRIQTIKDIAHDLFISEASVQRVLLDLADQYKPNLNYLPETLCIDEFKSMRSAKGKMSFIAVDGDQSCLFELLEDRRLCSLFKHYQQFTRQARCRVKYLVMDMNAAYDQLVKTVFPCAQIIYDRFHIAKHLNDTMKLPKVQQRFLYLKIPHRGCRLPCHDYNVQTTIEHRFLQSVTFPHQSRDPVSHDAVAYFFAYADSNPVFFGAIFLNIHDQIFVRI